MRQPQLTLENRALAGVTDGLNGSHVSLVVLKLAWARAGQWALDSKCLIEIQKIYSID